MDLTDVIDKLSTARGYMVSVSIADEEGKLTHTLITEKFEMLDMLPSNEEIKGLIIKQLEASNEQV